MNNQTDVSIKFKNSVTGEKKIEKYAETLSKIKSVLDGIDKGTIQQMENSSKNIDKMGDSSKEMSKNFNLAFDYTALRTFARGLSKVVEGFTAMTSKSTAFLEDFNLFQVAFRGNYTEATKFVNTLTEMYGLDEDWLIKTTSQFKQLSNAMGLANETGEKVSKLMTELSVDISSLYNIDVDRASSILQSALAGQTKPVRSLGADITQATLQQSLDKIDFGSQVADLSYAEKRLLIIISLTQQLSGVTNDWGRTLESPANQIRVMNEQWQRLQRNVGNVFLGIISKVLPYLNAILMVLNEIAKAIARLFGFKIDDFDYFDEGTVGGVEDFSDALDTAGTNAGKLKNQLKGLRGFDKLNVINSPNSAGGGGASGGGGGIGGINPKLTDALNKAFDEYQKKLKAVEMKATRIRDKIMEWLGFEKKVDEKTGEVYFKFKKITGGTILGLLAVGGAIYNGINFIFKILKRIGLIKFDSLKELFELFKNGSLVGKVSKLSSGFSSLAESLGMATSTLAIVVAGIVAIGVALVHAYKTSDEFREKVNSMVSSVLELFKTLYEFISVGLQEMWVVVEPIWNALKDTVGAVIQYCYDTIVFNFSNIIDVIKGVAQFITDIINGDFDKAFDDLVEMVKNVWNNFEKYLGKIIDNLIDWAGKMLENLIDFVPKFINKFGEILNWLGELPSKAGELIIKFVEKIIKILTETNWKAEGEKLITKICDGLKNIGSKLSDLGSKLKKKMKESFENINWGELGLNILKAIINGMKWTYQLRQSLGNGFIKGIKDALGIHSPAKLVLDAKIGDFSMDAIMLGMEREMPKLQKEAENIVGSLNSGIKEASMDSNFNYDLPQFNASSLNMNAQSIGNTSGNSLKQPINATFIIQVGNKEVARQVITDLQDIAKDNGKPITIGG